MTSIRWAAAATAYCATYVLVVWLVADDPIVRGWAGNVGLLLPPLLPIGVFLRRFHRWSGRTLVFWAAVAGGALLWWVGQAAWTHAELFDHRLLPWVDWPVAAKLCGGTLPVVALLAWPHASIRGASAASIALDIGGIAVVSLFLSWSLILAPGLMPATQALGIRALVVIGSLLHVIIVGGFAYAARSTTSIEWQAVYRRCAFGAGFGALLLLPNVAAMTLGRYESGSIGDIGWMLPFWLYAHAAADAPDVERETSTSLDEWADRSESGFVLLGALVVSPLIGYLPRYVLPLGQPIDRYRDLMTSVTLAICCGLAVARVAVEQRGRRRADYRVWLLATACEQAAELIVVIRSNAIEYANPAFLRAFGYSLAELRVLPPISLVDTQSMGTVADMKQTLGRGEITRATMSLRRRDGSAFPASCTVAPMMSASGQTAHFVGVVRDLTGELMLREQLVQSERMSAVGALVSNVAHEINNPLQAVTGATDLLVHQSADLAARYEVRQIRLGAERARDIVRKLLTWVRRPPRSRHLIDVSAVADEAVSRCGDALAAARIVVDRRYAHRVPLVHANREELVDVFSAVIRNAEEAMTAEHGGGTLVLSAYRSLSGSHAVLDIIDDGPGVRPEVAARIFEPFFTTKAYPRENGFGLAFAFSIVASHGGRLELVPTDRGACFRVTLPGVGASSTESGSEPPAS